MFCFLQRDASEQPDQTAKNMPEMANLVYNMYMHMIQASQKHRQVQPQCYCASTAVLLYFQKPDRCQHLRQHLCFLLIQVYTLTQGLKLSIAMIPQLDCREAMRSVSISGEGERCPRTVIPAAV